MSDVTDADREKARECIGDSYDEERERIAQALADEREKARAPFLALAAGFDTEAEDAAPAWPYVLPVQAIADKIRRAAEEQQ